MRQDPEFDKKKDIYSKYLQEISGVKFTIRETDILSCILHSRGEKKIAALLSISPNTVATHNRNIMVKLRCNSKDHIIDFIEKSGKLLQVRQYYVRLLIQAAFERYLRKIAAINRQNITCSINNLDPNAQELTHRVEQLQSDLRLANVFLKINAKEASEQNSRNLHIYTSANIEEKIPDEWVGLLFDDNVSPSKFQVRNLVNFVLGQNYYFSVFDLFEKIINKPEITNIKEDFSKEFVALLPVKENINIAQQASRNVEESIILNSVLQAETKLKLISKYIPSYKVLLSIFLITTLCTTTIWAYLYNSETKIVDNNTKSTIRSDLNIPVESVLLKRSDLIKKIDKTFIKSKNGIKTIVIVGVVGIGGVGKTTIARQYGLESKTNVIWELNAERKQSLINSFQDLAHVLAKTTNRKQELEYVSAIQSTKEKEKELLSLVKSWLKEEPNWLLIYDDVETIGIIKDYLPQDPEVWGNGKVIITTRDTNIQSSEYIVQENVIQIEELSDNEKLILFSKVLYNRSPSKLSLDEKTKATEFLKSIPPFPLDISAAACYLKSTNTSFDQYLKNLQAPNVEFEKVQESMFKENGHYTKTRNNIITTSLQHIMDTNESFVELALFISLLNFQNIPRSLLEKYKGSIVIDDFIFNLKKYSFITNESSSPIGQTFSIHSSTQWIIRAYLTQKLNLTKNKEFLSHIADLLELYVNELLDQEDYFKSNLLLDHCETFLSRDILTDEITESIGVVLGGIYCELEQYNKTTEQLLEKIIKNLEKHGNKNTDKIALSLSYLGATARYLGDIEKGKDLLEKSIVIYQTNQENCIGSARAMSYLGDINRILGNYDKAKSLLEKSIAIYQQNHANHKGAARAMIYLGKVYRDIGNYSKAKDVIEQSIIIYQKRQDDINTAFSIACLGDIQKELGNYDKAEALLEQSITIYNSYPKSSPYNIGWTLSYLGTVYDMLGDYNKAKNAFEQSITIYERYYGKNDHINIGWILTNLGNVHRELGNYDKAKDLIEHGFKIHKLYFHKDHPDIGWNLLYLGKAYNSLGDDKKARAYLEQSLAIYKKHYGEYHIQIARVLSALGENYLLQTNTLEYAENIITKAKDIFQKEKHPEIRIPLEFLGDLYSKKAQIAKSRNDIQLLEDFRMQSTNHFKQALEYAQTYLTKDSAHIIRLNKKLMLISHYY